jgi:hypothetical protein
MCLTRILFFSALYCTTLRLRLEGTHVRQCKEKSVFPLHCPHFIVPLHTIYKRKLRGAEIMRNA